MNLLYTTLKSFSCDEIVKAVLFSNVVALVVSLNISCQCLEVEIRQQVLHLEHDVLKEFIIEFRCPS